VRLNTFLTKKIPGLHPPLMPSLSIINCYHLAT
jgi:hypothetical protein